jgi:cell division septal protein FtsQ
MVQILAPQKNPTKNKGITLLMFIVGGEMVAFVSLFYIFLSFFKLLLLLSHVSFESNFTYAMVFLSVLEW